MGVGGKQGKPKGVEEKTKVNGGFISREELV